MSNEDIIQEIHNELINKNRFLENEIEIFRRQNDWLLNQNQMLLDIINNELNRRDKQC